ncbi:MAG: SDR family oxidoreductase [Stigonema ocellatum SAG 48.90 = DSM 106950]|nr:SDR family oxidoreductase [Stigonema ocellatum SAG 48.90 = DSM 106950]
MGEILTGKIAVVTGGSAGIGYAIARRFASSGAKVILASRQPQRLAAAAKSIGDSAVAMSTDVSDVEQVQRLFEGLARVDILVTCAGGAHFGAIDTVPVAQAKSLFEGRFFGQLAAAHYAVPKMPPGSVIIFCSGIAARVGLPYYSAGSALCGAVNSMTRALAVELAPRGIRVNAISPGLIEGTDIQSNLSKEQVENLASSAIARIPLKRAGNSNEVADAAFFLATCGYVTGQIIEVDGGWTAS